MLTSRAKEKAAYGSHTWCIMQRGPGICALPAAAMLTVKHCKEQMDCTRWSQTIRAIQGRQMSNLLWWTECGAEARAPREFLIRWKFSPQKQQTMLPQQRMIAAAARNVCLLLLRGILQGLLPSMRMTNIVILLDYYIGRAIEGNRGAEYTLFFCWSCRNLVLETFLLKCFF